MMFYGKHSGARSQHYPARCASLVMRACYDEHVPRDTMLIIWRSFFLVSFAATFFLFFSFSYPFSISSPHGLKLLHKAFCLGYIKVVFRFLYVEVKCFLTSLRWW